jgi:hypothetical protein
LVGKIHFPIDNDMFPNILARARKHALTEKNIKMEFQKTGIWPFNLRKILDKLRLLTPELPDRTREPELPAGLESRSQMVLYCSSTPTSPRSFSAVFKEGLAVMNSTSPATLKAKMAFTKMNRALHLVHTKMKMHQRGEAIMQERVVEIESKQRADKRKLDPNGMGGAQDVHCAKILFVFWQMIRECDMKTRKQVLLGSAKQKKRKVNLQSRSLSC